MATQLGSAYADVGLRSTVSQDAAQINAQLGQLQSAFNQKPVQASVGLNSGDLEGDINRAFSSIRALKFTAGIGDSLRADLGNGLQAVRVFQDALEQGLTLPPSAKAEIANVIDDLQQKIRLFQAGLGSAAGGSAGQAASTLARSLQTIRAELGQVNPALAGTGQGADQLGQQLRGLQRDVDHTQQFMSGFFNTLKQGILFGGAFAAGSSLAGFIKSTAQETIGLNQQFEGMTTTFRTMTGDANKAREYFAALKKEADITPFGTSDLISAGAALLPFSKTQETLIENVRLAEQLAALAPEQGLQGATFALREALSDDFTSLIERFNISRGTVKELRAEFGEYGQGLTIVREALTRMGVTQELVSEQATTFTGRLSTVQSFFEDVKREFGGALFENLKVTLKELQVFLDANREQILAFASAAGGQLASAFALLINVGKSLFSVWESLGPTGQQLVAMLVAARVAGGAVSSALGPLMSGGGGLISLFRSLAQTATGFGAVTQAAQGATVEEIKAIEQTNTLSRVMGGLNAALIGLGLGYAVGSIIYEGMVKGGRDAIDVTRPLVESLKELASVNEGTAVGAFVGQQQQRVEALKAEEEAIKANIEQRVRAAGLRDILASAIVGVGADQIKANLPGESVDSITEEGLAKLQTLQERTRQLAQITEAGQPFLQQFGRQVTQLNTEFAAGTINSGQFAKQLTAITGIQGRDVFQVVTGLEKLPDATVRVEALSRAAGFYRKQLEERPDMADQIIPQLVAIEEKVQQLRNAAPVTIDIKVTAAIEQAQLRVLSETTSGISRFGDQIEQLDSQHAQRVQAFGQQRARQREDFNKQEGRAAEDHGRRIAQIQEQAQKEIEQSIKDSQMRQRQMTEDFELQSRRSEEDFTLQKRRLLAEGRIKEAQLLEEGFRREQGRRQEDFQRQQNREFGGQTGPRGQTAEEVRLAQERDRLLAAGQTVEAARKAQELETARRRADEDYAREAGRSGGGGTQADQIRERAAEQIKAENENFGRSKADRRRSFNEQQAEQSQAFDRETQEYQKHRGQLQADLASFLDAQKLKYREAADEIVRIEEYKRQGLSEAQAKMKVQLEDQQREIGEILKSRIDEFGASGQLGAQAWMSGFMNAFGDAVAIPRDVAQRRFEDFKQRQVDELEGATPKPGRATGGFPGKEEDDRAMGQRTTASATSGLTTVIGAVTRVFDQATRDIRRGGQQAGEAWIEGFSGAFSQVGAALNQSLTKVRRNTVGQSPPPEGPLADIDIGALRIGQSWSRNFALGLSAADSALNPALRNIRDRISRVDENAPFLAGRTPPPTGANAGAISRAPGAGPEGAGQPRQVTVTIPLAVSMDGQAVGRITAPTVMAHLDQDLQIAVQVVDASTTAGTQQLSFREPKGG